MLNQKDSKDLISLEFPELMLIRKNLVQSLDLLAMEINKAMTRQQLTRVGKIFNFAHFLFDHSDKYVQLLLIDQFYKKLNFIHCDLLFGNKKSKMAEMPQLPYHISYRCTNFQNHFQLTRISIK
jgi:hypothetical protein